jgi:16S rRNA (guanine527-N7)-methyltransferase
VGEAPLTREGFARELDVSRETIERLAIHLELLERWQGAINLVGPKALHDPWRRLLLDSAQLVRHLPPHAASLVDLGSGAGFPGLVLAILGVPGVRLIESDRRKAVFLREAARLTGAPVEVHADRIERMTGFSSDVVTARGLAPLPRLLGLAARFLTPATVCLFLKGRNLAGELTEARKTWHMVAHMSPSLSDPMGVVLELREIRRARDRQP